MYRLNEEQTDGLAAGIREGLDKEGFRLSLESVEAVVELTLECIYRLNDMTEGE